MDITEFLAARLAEREADARRIIDVWERAERPLADFGRYICDPVIGPFGGQSRLRDVAFGLYVADVANPARILAEVEAVRQLLEWISAWQADVATEGFRLLALPYADHPDYDPAWRA